MKHALALILPVLVLSACATPYQPDLVGKPSARVRMVSTHSMFGPASVLTSSCVPYSALQWDSNTQRLGHLPSRGSTPKRESIGIPLADLPEYASFTEHRIAAGEPISLAFYGTLYSYPNTVKCAVGARFTPTEGADYQAIFSERAGGGCAIAVHRLISDPDGKVKEAAVEGLRFLPRC